MLKFLYLLIKGVNTSSLLLYGLVVWIFALASTLRATVPNVIFILADDLGWSELGCYGNTYNETPCLDRLAERGMRFTNAYAAAPVCSPFRASLMTGQYPARVGIYKWLDVRDFDKNMPRQYTTLPEKLKQGGYSTGIIGKWHLSCYAANGDPDPITAQEQGFEEVIAGATTYIGNGDYWHPYWIMPALPKAGVVLDENYPQDEYLVDRMNYEAVNFIERNKEKPFFLYLSHYAVHTTLDGKPDVVSHFEAKPGSGKGAQAPVNNPHLAAQLFSIDQGIGMIVDKLTELDLLDNTIIVFTGDNGGAGNVTDNGVLRGAKGSLYEGGVRIPMIVSWPERVQSGVQCDEPVISCDYYPTFAEIANVALPAGQRIDGVSIMPLLTGNASAFNRDALYWYYPYNSQSSIRSGNWKLIENLSTGAIDLFELGSDISETTPRQYDNPEKAMELLTKLRNWRADIPRLLDVNGNGEIEIGEFQDIAGNWLEID
ncbi:MAG: sulfatase [Sedimentisphaerales bacterium]|nr:sulfatase [Sedimentisphaerales bacterium]MBN2843091.1 sulfatase [Sedimentisphaerales bacterium]